MPFPKKKILYQIKTRYATPKVLIEVNQNYISILFSVERAGSRALSTFVRVLSAEVLRAHRGGALTRPELERRLGRPPATSLRLAVANLGELGALARDRHRPVTTGLTSSGRDLLAVADALDSWLARSPSGPFALGDQTARDTIGALVAGWESTVVRVLAERPRGLAELSSNVAGHSYPALKRRLARMRTAALVTPVEDRARSPLHAATPLLRHAVHPIGLAVRWERCHLPDAVPLEERDLEAVVLLARPLPTSGRASLAPWRTLADL